MDGRSLGPAPVYATVDTGKKCAVVIQLEGYRKIEEQAVFYRPDRVEYALVMTEEHKRSREIERTEWVALSLGVSVVDGEVGFCESFSLFTLKWKHLYWTIIDAGVALSPESSEDGSADSFLSIATSLGVPFNLGSLGRHQIRLGLGLGMCMQTGPSDTSQGFCFSPSVGYVYQTGTWYHLGVKVGTFVSTDSQAPFPVILSLITPLGWTGSAD